MHLRVHRSSSSIIPLFGLFRTPSQSQHSKPVANRLSLTFVYALLAGVFGYFYLIRSYSRSDDSIARFYDAFTACALESDLVRRDILASSSADLVLDEALDRGNGPGYGSKVAEKGNVEGLKAASAIPLPAKTLSKLSESLPQCSTRSDTRDRYTQQEPSGAPGQSPYLLDPDSLARLYSHVRAVEIDLQREAAKVVSQNARDQEWGGRWDRLLGRSKWINRAGELQAGLEKREALTPRLLVVQMSLAAGRSKAQAERMGELEAEIARLKDKVGSWESSTTSQTHTEDKVDV